MQILITYFDNRCNLNNKKREPLGSRYHLTLKHHYMCLTIASPNSEHFSSLAPSIRRSKS